MRLRPMRNQELDLTQLRHELARELALSDPPPLHYNPAESWIDVELDVDQAPVALRVLAEHVPDKRRQLSPESRELLELMEADEQEPLTGAGRARMDELQRAHFRQQILGGGR